MNAVVYKFNSVGDLSKHLATAKVTKTFENVYENGSFCERSSYFKWCKTNTYQEADDLMLYGDKELQQKIEDAGVQDIRMKISQNGQRRQMYSSVVGFAPNVPAYVSGAPNSMINMRMVRTKQRVISVMYNTSVAGSISADKIIRAAAMLVSAIMLIEANGVRVNLYTGEATQQFRESLGVPFLSIVRIKDSGQMIDTLKMSYPLAHPSMLRRQEFRLMETSELPTSYKDNYGYPIKDEKTVIDLLKKNQINNIERVLCYYDIAGCETPQEVVELITNYNK